MPSNPRRNKLPSLPKLAEQKLTKTGYTRGATTKEVYQNRVSRNNPVLIPWERWEECKVPDDGTDAYERGFIVLVEPSWYFARTDSDEQLAAEGIELGINAILIYQRRSDWIKYRPSASELLNGTPLTIASSRSNPLGGNYFARVHGVTGQVPCGAAA